MNRYAIDMNYGNVLIIWDRIFGTFAEEREDEKLTYGTVTQKDNNHIVGLMVSSRYIVQCGREVDTGR